MTLQKACRITGLDIQVLAEAKNFIVYALNGHHEVVRVSGRNLKTLLSLAVERVYAINREVAMERAGWRCERCGKITGVTAHHKVHRARGQRDDRVENLEVLCAEHHGKEHGG